MNEPEHALVAAAAAAAEPHVRALRERGWAVEVIVQGEPPSVSLRIDLSGLKQPVESDPRSADHTGHITKGDDGLWRNEQGDIVVTFADGRAAVVKGIEGET